MKKIELVLGINLLMDLFFLIALTQWFINLLIIPIIQVNILFLVIYSFYLLNQNSKLKKRVKEIEKKIHH